MVEKWSTPFLKNYVFEPFGPRNLIELVVKIKMLQIARQMDPCIPFLKHSCCLFFLILASLFWRLITLPCVCEFASKQNLSILTDENVILSQSSGHSPSMMEVSRQDWSPLLENKVH